MAKVKVIIYLADKDKYGVVQFVATLIKHDGNGVPILKIQTKESLIKDIDDLRMKNDVSIYTKKDVEVFIVNDKYLRSEEDGIKEDNLADLPPVDMNDIMTTNFKQYAKAY